MTAPNETPDEVAVLKQTLAEVQAKAVTRKARIKELETSLATAQADVTAAQASLHNIEVKQPVRTLANAISPAPELFLMEFARVGFSVEKRNDKLTILKDGTPVEGSEFTVEGVTKLLAKSDDPALKSFRHLVIVSRANGGGASGVGGAGQVHSETTNPAVAKPKSPQFGLR